MRPRPWQRRFCAVCKDKVKAEDWCHGCGQYICEACDVRHPDGVHPVERHERPKRPGEQR